MTQAKRDNNYVATLLGVDSDTLEIPTLLAVDPITHRLLVDSDAGEIGTSTVVTQVASSATSVTLKASNTSRIKLVIANDSTAILYVKEGTTASATDYTYRLAAQDAVIIDDYSGRVDGIWASANGNAYVSETS